MRTWGEGWARHVSVTVTGVVAMFDSPWIRSAMAQSESSISAANPAPLNGRPYRFLWAWAHPRRTALVSVLVLMALQSVVALATPWLAGTFSAALLAAKPVGLLLACWFVVIAVQVALGYAVGVLSQSLTSGLVADASTRVFDHLQSLPVGWHGDRRRGDVLALATEDVHQLARYVAGTLTPLLPLLLTCAGALLMMVRVDVGLGLSVALLLPLIFIGLRLAGRSLRPLSRQEFEAYSRKWALAEQNLAMLPIIKAFSGEAAESWRYAEQAARL